MYDKILNLKLDCYLNELNLKLVTKLLKIKLKCFSALKPFSVILYIIFVLNLMNYNNTLNTTAEIRKCCYIKHDRLINE